jgi:hypothetical protein
MLASRAKISMLQPETASMARNAGIRKDSDPDYQEKQL